MPRAGLVWRRSTDRLTLAAGLVAVLATASQAAPWAPRSKAARDALNAAADAADRGDFTAAATLSLESLDHEPTIAAHWNAGQAYAAAGDWPRALAQYQAALADRDIPAKQRARVEPRRRLAQAFVDADAARAATRWDDARAAYLAILAGDGLDVRDREHASTALERVARERAAAEAAPAPLDFVPTPAPAPVASSPPPPEPERPPPATASRWNDTAALVLTGVGLVGLAAGSGMIWHAGALDDQAATEPDQAAQVDLRDRSDTWQLGGTITLAAGGAVLVGGLIKLAIAPDAPRAPLAVAPTANGAMLVFGGGF